MFGPRKGRRTVDGLAATDEQSGREAIDGSSPQHEAWRRAAQDVTRTWSEWLAGDSRSRPELYQRYTCALDKEDEAAATLALGISEASGSAPAVEPAVELGASLTTAQSAGAANAPSAPA